MNSPASNLEMHDLIDDRPVGFLQVVVLTICMLTSMVDGLDTQIIGILAPVMAPQLGSHVKNFAPVFSAGLIGMLVGSIFIGALADRYGRKSMIVFSLFIFGALSFVTASVTTVSDLILLRFLTGVGLGGALPNAIALASEYVPTRYSRTTVAVMVAGLPAGAFIGGGLSTVLIPHFGWRAVFIIGGALPIIVGVIALLIMPESARFLVSRGVKSRQLSDIVRKIAPDVEVSQLTSFSSAKGRSGLPFKGLFTSGRAIPTILLWIPYVMNLIVIYFIASWMPAVLSGALPSPLDAIWAITLYHTGGFIGCLVQGPLMTRFGMRRVIVLELILYVLLSVTIAKLVPSAVVITSICFLIGVAVQGVQAGLNSLAVETYPVDIRATGVGCAVGVGRIGSIAGPILGGILMQLNWHVGEIFVAGAIPAVFSLIAVVVNKAARQKAVTKKPCRADGEK